MEHKHSNWRDTHELVLILDRVGDWTLHGQGGRVLCHTASLREAIKTTVEYREAGQPVIALCKQPDESIIVFWNQIEPLIAECKGS